VVEAVSQPQEAQHWFNRSMVSGWCRLVVQQGRETDMRALSDKQSPASMSKFSQEQQRPVRHLQPLPNGFNLGQRERVGCDGERLTVSTALIWRATQVAIYQYAL